MAEMGISEVTMELTPDTTLGTAVLKTEVTIGRTEVRGSWIGVVAAVSLAAEATALETMEVAAETMELMSDVAIGKTDRLDSVGRMFRAVLDVVALIDVG